MLRKKIPQLVFFITLSLLTGICTLALAGEAQVAVASNFIGPLKSIQARFEKDTGHRMVLIPGSTGKLYAQIKHGAPFDIFSGRR